MRVSHNLGFPQTQLNIKGVSTRYCYKMTRHLKEVHSKIKYPATTLSWLGAMVCFLSEAPLFQVPSLWVLFLASANVLLQHKFTSSYLFGLSHTLKFVMIYWLCHVGRDLGVVFKMSQTLITNQNRPHMVLVTHFSYGV